MAFGLKSHSRKIEVADIVCVNFNSTQQQKKIAWNSEKIYKNRPVAPIEEQQHFSSGGEETTSTKSGKISKIFHFLRNPTTRTHIRKSSLSLSPLLLSSKSSLSRENRNRIFSAIHFHFSSSTTREEQQGKVKGSKTTTMTTTTIMTIEDES